MRTRSKSPAEHRGPWSPDSSRIAFLSDRDGNQEIYVVNVGDGKITQLTDNHVDDEGDHAGWSPNGKLFSFSSRSDGGSDGRGV